MWIWVSQKYVIKDGSQYSEFNQFIHFYNYVYRCMLAYASPRGDILTRDGSYIRYGFCANISPRLRTMQFPSTCIGKFGGRAMISYNYSSPNNSREVDATKGDSYLTHQDIKNLLYPH